MVAVFLFVGGAAKKYAALAAVFPELYIII